MADPALGRLRCVPLHRTHGYTWTCPCTISRLAPSPASTQRPRVHVEEHYWKHLKHLRWNAYSQQCPRCVRGSERGRAREGNTPHLICCRAARSRPAPWLASRVQPCPCRRRRPNRVMEASKRGAVASRRSRRGTLVAASSWAAFSSAAFCSAIAAVSAFFFGDGKNGKRGIVQQGAGKCGGSIRRSSKKELAQVNGGRSRRSSLKELSTHRNARRCDTAPSHRQVTAIPSHPKPAQPQPRRRARAVKHPWDRRALALRRSARVAV